MRICCLRDETLTETLFDHINTIVRGLSKKRDRSAFVRLVHESLYHIIVNTDRNIFSILLTVPCVAGIVAGSSKNRLTVSVEDFDHGIRMIFDPLYNPTVMYAIPVRRKDIGNDDVADHDHAHAIDRSTTCFLNL